MGKKYFSIIFWFMASFGLLAPAQANIVIGSVARSGQWGTIQFDYTGGDLIIDSLANGYTGGPTGSGIDDITLTLLIDNGSPLTAFTGPLVAFNDDRSPSFGIDGSTSSRDSTLTLPTLASNSYLLAIGHTPKQFSGDISSGSAIAASAADYKITFSADVFITALDGISTLQTPATATIPEPAPFALLGFGLLGLGVLRKRRG